MPAMSFINQIFPQFSVQNWKIGVAIYRAGGISAFSGTKELVNAKVKSGIGENYDVRAKLHGQGKCVQWMECTCQAYRRRNEKCPHLAAFCIYIDQEKSALLTRMNMSAGDSDRYLYTEKYSRSTTPEPLSEDSPKPRDSTLEETLAHGAELSAIEPAWIQQSSNVVSVDISEKEPLLLLNVVIRDRGKITYCLGVDDAHRAITYANLSQHYSTKFKKIQKEDAAAKRFFEIKKFGKTGIQILRCVSLKNTKDGTESVLALDKYPKNCVGKNAIFHKSHGYIPFSDVMPPQQVARWQEYPANAILEGDTAAMLVETKFQRLAETTEVRVAEELSHLSVVGSLEFTQLKLQSSGNGFVTVDTENIHSGNLLEIIKARAEGKKFLATEKGWIKISDDLAWLNDKVQKDGKLKLTTLDFIKFRERYASKSEILGTGKVVERLRTGLISSQDLEEPSLEDTKLSLRPYQVDGLKWLWWLYCNGLGGLLADEMGLGKTHQAMALISTIAKTETQKLTLVVCPTSVIDHWLDKIRRFVPGLDVVCYHGANRRLDALQTPKGHRVIVTSYGVMLRDAGIFSEKQWSLVILDEAHLVKNQSTRTYISACRIPSQMRLCLTGTPLENELMELKNLFDYILPNYLGSDADFKRKYVIASDVDPLSALDLHRIIHPFKMRRNKVDVLVDLPEKVEDIKHCHLRKEQHKLYLEALALKGSPLLDSLKTGAGPIPYVHVFAVITLLKQICNDPALVDPRYQNMGSGKLEVLDEIVAESLASNQKIVIFSQYAKMVARLSERFARQGIRHVTLTGSTTKRGDVIREFQENAEIKIFVGSLLAGGAGIDLTAASVVIHFDRWWNAAKENQATDRIHRFGQMRNVQVYKLVTRGTLEERIDEIIARKRIVFERFIEQDTEMFKQLTREDLLNLLATPNESATGSDIEAEEALLRNSIEDAGTL
jgi:superfamily II DNA or RNA helicase